MALVVENGTVVAGAESYASVEQANAYCMRWGLTAFLALSTDPEKEVKLRKATRYLDLRFGDDLAGRRVSSSQSLLFPRYNIPDQDGLAYLPENPLPQRLIDATIEAANKACSEELFVDEKGGGKIISESVQAGPISKSVDYRGSGRDQQKRYKEIEKLMFPLLCDTDSGRLWRT